MNTTHTEEAVMPRPIKVVLTRRGFEQSYTFMSIKGAAQAVGRSVSTVKARLEDGYALYTNQGIPVHVRYQRRDTTNG